MSASASSKAETQFFRNDGLKVSFGLEEVLKARRASAESSEVEIPLFARIFLVSGDGRGQGDDLDSSEKPGELCERMETDASESSEFISV